MDNRPVILVIDDEPANIEIVTAVLEDEYEICFALSGEQAVQVARESRPDLILLDVVMPGMDGYQLCRIFKADPLLSDIPVIFATALGDDEAELRGLASVRSTMSPSRSARPPCSGACATTSR